MLIWGWMTWVQTSIFPSKCQPRLRIASSQVWTSRNLSHRHTMQSKQMKSLCSCTLMKLKVTKILKETTEKQCWKSLPVSYPQASSQDSELMMPRVLKLCQTTKLWSRRIARISKPNGTLKMTFEIQKNLKKRRRRDEAKRRLNFHGN